MKRRALLSIVLIALARLGGYADTSEKTQRTGDLLVGLVRTEQREPKANSDHHIVLVRFRAHSIAKQALCVGFSATLKATFGLEYRGSLSVTNPFRVRELLPGEDTEGDYEFFVKNGAEPLQVILKTSSDTQTCAPGKDTFSAIWHSSGELTFDIAGQPEHASQSIAGVPPPSQGNTAPETDQDEAAAIRVFLTGAKGGPAEQNAVKAFQDRCPQARITTVREKANYVVTLSPAGFRQSKNQVTVVNAAGDMIHTGATFNLHNAAGDACAAVLKDSNLRLQKNVQR